MTTKLEYPPDGTNDMQNKKIKITVWCCVGGGGGGVGGGGVVVIRFLVSAFLTPRIDDFTWQSELEIINIKMLTVS